MHSSGLLFTPSDVLPFLLSPGMPAQAVLNIVNHHLNSVAFKVKTTTPERYLVKPNHGVILEGGHTDITVLLVQAKKREILVKALDEQHVDCNDKFLVQTAVIDSKLVSDLNGLPAHELADVISQMFNNMDKRDVKAKKLLVEYSVSQDESKPRFSSRNDSVRLLQTSSVSTSDPMPGTPDGMFAEVVALRKKYDDLVAFTVNLTAERDALATELAYTQHNIASCGECAEVRTESLSTVARASQSCQTAYAHRWIARSLGLTVCTALISTWFWVRCHL